MRCSRTARSSASSTSTRCSRRCGGARGERAADRVHRDLPRRGPRAARSHRRDAPRLEADSPPADAVDLALPRGAHDQGRGRDGRARRDRRRSPMRWRTCSSARAPRGAFPVRPRRCAAARGRRAAPADRRRRRARRDAHRRDSPRAGQTSSLAASTTPAVPIAAAEHAGTPFDSRRAGEDRCAPRPGRRDGAPPQAPRACDR